MPQRSRLLRDLALQRMRILYSLGAEATKLGEVEYSRRYGELIRAISMRVRVRIPRYLKRWICRRCNAIMVPGYNARIRTRREGRALRVVTTCLSCGWVHRYQFTRR